MRCNNNLISGWFNIAGADINQKKKDPQKIEQCPWKIPQFQYVIVGKKDEKRNIKSRNWKNHAGRFPG